RHPHIARLRPYPLRRPQRVTRILIADDDDLMRAGLVELLSNDPTIEIIGEATTGREAVERTRRLAPDVVLMDVRMPDLDGIAATRELSPAHPSAKTPSPPPLPKKPPPSRARPAGPPGNSWQTAPAPKTSSPPCTRSPAATRCCRRRSPAG